MIFFPQQAASGKQTSTLKKKKKKKVDLAVCILSWEDCIESEKVNYMGSWPPVCKEHHTTCEVRPGIRGEEARYNMGSKHYKELERFNPFCEREPLSYYWNKNTFKNQADMEREKHGNIYVTTCKMDCQWEFAVLLRELKTGLCNNLEWMEGRWKGGLRGRRHIYVYGWLILMFGRKPTQYCKTIILHLK